MKPPQSPPPTAKCPRCDEQIDIAVTISHDRILCQCGVWLYVLHRPGGTHLYPCQSPYGWREA